MSKDQRDTHLRYGQGIIIKGYKAENDPDSGYLTVRGFADTQANYQTTNDILFFKNYRNAIFELLPAGKFEINDELHKLQNQVNDTKQEQQKVKRTISTLQVRAKSQKMQFQLGIKRNKKTTIKFGDSVMLRHIDSQTYLSGTLRPSNGSNGAFTVQVSNKLSKALQFQLLPYRSFEAQSMQIPFSSPLLIKNLYNNGYLTFQKIENLDQLNAQDRKGLNKLATQSDKSYKIPVKTQSDESKVYEVVTYFIDLSNEQSGTQMPWQFQLHFKQVQNDSLIQHDIVYLRHTKNNGILSAVGQNIVLKQSKLQNSQGLQFYQSLWEIEKQSEEGSRYIFRHLMSGMTLGVKRNQSGDPDCAILIDISKGHGNCQIGSVQLKLAKKDSSEINSQSYIYLCQNQFILDVTNQQQALELQKSSIVVQSDQLINTERMKKLAALQTQYQICELKFTQNIPKNCFIIQQIEDQLKKQLLFALSFHSTIINLRQDLKFGATDSMKKVDYIRMMKVTQKIAQINDFLKGCQPNDPQKQFKLPIYKRQMICKDLGLSQLLFQLLFFMRENMKEQIFKQKINERQKFHQMHQTIYQVIINLIKDNRIFKIHVSKWIKFIIQDFIEKDIQIHYNALIQLLKNNQFFIQNFVTPHLIDYILQHMLKERNLKQWNQKRYIDVLRAFCLVGQKVYSYNQSLILKYFIQKLQSLPEGNCYQIKFIQEGADISCKVALDKKNIGIYKFQQFKKLCKDAESSSESVYPKSWQYYTAYLNLLSDITKGRSKSIEKYVAKELPLDLLTQLFDSCQLQQFEVPVIKILHYLYSQNQNFYPIDKENRIAAYDSIQSSEITVNHFTGPYSPWNYMERVLNKLIQKLSKAQPILPKQIEVISGMEDYRFKKNQVLLQLLLLTEQTLNLGFWLKKQDISNIYTCIINILKKHPDLDYQQAKKINKQNQLMIVCKIQCLKIIDLIIDQDFNISQQIFNKVFRQFEIPQDENNLTQNPSFMFNDKQYKFPTKFLADVEQRSKDQEPIVNIQIYEQMIELRNYNNSQLTSKSLQILSRIIDANRHKLSRFFSQLFICEPDCVMFAQFLTSLKTKFFILEDINTPKITQENQSQNYFNIYNEQPGPYKQSQTSGIMQDMYMITELMKNQNSLFRIQEIMTIDQSGIFRRLGTDQLINFTECRKSSNLMKQKIVDAANIHLKILTYMLNCQQVPQSQLAVKLLHLCYYLIVSLIQNHQEMKPKIVKYLPKLIKHLKKNVGYVDLLRQMYDNNKNMLINQLELFPLIRIFCDQINKQTKILYKSKLLDFFRYLIYLNNKCLQKNQILILKIMQDDDYKNILGLVTVEIIKNFVFNYKLLNDYGQFKDNLVKCQPDLIYLSAYFQTLTSLIDQNNKVNIGKLVKRFPFQMLTECITASQDCWFIKRNIRAVINRMYYFSVGTNVYLSLILKNQIPTIIDDLDRFIAIKYMSNRQKLEKLQSIRFQNPVRFTYLESYFYLNLQQNLFTLFSMLNTQELFSQFEAILKTSNQSCQLGDNLIRIGQRLGQIRRYFLQYKNVYTIGIIRFLQMRLTQLLKSMKIDLFKQGLKDVWSQIKGVEQLQEKAKKQLIQKILEGEIQQFYINDSEAYKTKTPLVYLSSQKVTKKKSKHQRDDDKLLKKLRQIFTRKKVKSQSRDDQVITKMWGLVSAIKFSNKINNQLVKSFENNIVKSYSSGGYTGQQQLLHYISVLININQTNPQILSDDLKIFILKIINSLFYQQNRSKQEVQQQQGGQSKQEIKQQQIQQKKEQQVEQKEQNIKQIDEWEAQEWSDNSTKITELQNKLQQCGIGSFLTSLIKGNICSNITLANSILLCSISYMLGGNKDTQNNIRQQLNKDPQNKILLNIKKLINNLGMLIRKNIDQKQNINIHEEDHVQQYHINCIDNYDFYDVNLKYCTRKNVSEPHYVDQILQNRLRIVTYRRAFKFLQLLCQNNNIDNKNFIREQPGTSESINFIQIATKELRENFLILNEQISELPIFILDFILEVTQIPLILNQQTLIKSSFFEDVCQFANNTRKDDFAKNRGFNQDRDALDQIFQKCVQIILSNFEGNSQDYFRWLDQKLDTDFLVQLLTYKLSNLDIKTKQDFFNYVQKITEPQQQNGKLISNTTFDENITGILQIIIIFMKLKDIVGEENSRVYKAYIKQKQGKKANEQLFNALQSVLLKIQIFDSNNSIQIVYFPNHPVFNSISNGLKDYIMSEVKRETRRQKIVSLLGFVDGINQKINQAYNFQKCQKTSESVMNSYYKYSSYLSIIIVIYMTLFYNVYIEYGQAQFTASWPIVIIRFMLSLLQLKYALIYGYTWYKLKVWFKPQQKSIQKQSDVKQLIRGIIRHSTTLPQPEISESFVQKTWFFIKNKLTDILHLRTLQQKFNHYMELAKKHIPYLNKIISQLKQFKQAIAPEKSQQTEEPQKIQNSGQFIRIVLYIFFSFMGTFVNPIYFFVHLIDVICTIEVLGNIFQAIGLVIKPLLMICAMGVAFVGVFCSITFSNYMKNVYGEVKNQNLMCNNPINCILALFVSGAIGQTMEKFQIIRFLYDMIYAIFFGLLFGNIISGLMLDAFGSLGDTRDQLENDKKNFCFMCNISREKLEKNGQKFQQHISARHHLWNYIFYIISLLKKDATDYTGLQYYIYQKYYLPDQQKDVTWIPNGQDVSFDKQKDAKQMIKQLDMTQQANKDQLKALQGKIKQFIASAESYAQ